MTTIYTLGDIDIFWHALNAIAMLFNPANTTLWNGAGYFGMGSIMGLGLLISLIILAVQGVLRNEGIRYEQLLVMIVLYVALFVPQTSVQLEDMYTGQVRIVDNVPIGVAYTGGIISSITHSIAVKIETAFSTVDGNYIAQTTDGFVSPLRLLYSLRRLSLRNIERADPYIAQSMMDYVRYCDYGSSSFDESTLDSSSNAVGYALQPRLGMTVYYNQANPQGVGMSCDDASSNLSSDLINFFNQPVTLSNGNPYDLSRAELLLNSAMGANPSTTGLTQAPWRLSDYNQAFVSMFGSIGADSTQFMEDTLWDNIVTNSLRCGAAGNNYDFYTCNAQMTQSLEQAKQQAAGQANLFQQIMIPTMNIFEFMFFAFAPLIAMVMALTGLHGIKVAMNYLLFGVWTQTWLPVAAVINFFIQLQVSGDIQAITQNNPTIANMSQLYNALSTKLMVASNLLAATPLITLALLTGSIFAMTRVAGASVATAERAFDPKMGAPDLMHVEPAMSLQGQSVSTQGFGVGGLATGGRGLASTLSQGAISGTLTNNYSTASQMATTAMHSIASEAAASTSASVAQSVSDTANHLQEARAHHSLSSQDATTLQHMRDVVQKHLRAAGYNGTVSDNDVLSIAAATSDSLGARLGGKVLAAVGAGESAEKRAAKARALGSIISSSKSHSLASGTSDGLSDSSVLQSGWNKLRGESASAGTAWQKARSSAKSYAETMKDSTSLSRRAALAQSSGGSLSVNSGVFFSSMLATPDGVDKVLDADAYADRVLSQNLSPEGRETYNKLIANRTATHEMMGIQPLLASAISRMEAASLLPGRLSGRDREQAMIAGEQVMDHVYGFDNAMNAGADAASQMADAGKTARAARTGLAGGRAAMSGVPGAINSGHAAVTGAYNRLSSTAGWKAAAATGKTALEGRYQTAAGANTADYKQHNTLGDAYAKDHSATHHMMALDGTHQNLPAAEEATATTDQVVTGTKDGIKSALKAKVDTARSVYDSYAGAVDEGISQAAGAIGLEGIKEYFEGGAQSYNSAAESRANSLVSGYDSYAGTLDRVVAEAAGAVGLDGAKESLNKGAEFYEKEAQKHGGLYLEQLEKGAPRNLNDEDNILTESEIEDPEK